MMHRNLARLGLFIEIMLLFNVASVWCEGIFGGWPQTNAHRNVDGYFEANHADDDSSPVHIQVNLAQTIHVTSEKYLSVVMGPVTIRSNWSTFDLKSKRLHVLASALAPCILRLGGNFADFLIFNETDIVQPPPSPSEEEMFLLYDTYSGLSHKNYTNFYMSSTQWDQLNNFVHEVGWELLFDLNVLLRTSTHWDWENAEKLLQYSIKKNYTSHLNFELGNEPNAFPHALGRNVTASQLGHDFLALYFLLRARPEFKSHFKGSLLVGPDVTRPKVPHPELNVDSPEYLRDFLQVAGHSLNAITWHQYYIDGKEATAKDFLNPDVLNLYLEEAIKIKQVVQETGFLDKELWMGETGSCWSGGAPRFSDRFLGGFFWLDKLGLAAKLGHSVVLRQTFYEGKYRLIDKQLYPNPDYWLSLLFKRLVGPGVLETLSGSQYLRAYCHCTNRNKLPYPKGSVTLFSLNLIKSPVNITVSSQLGSSIKHAYWLTPHGVEGLQASHVNLNGRKLKLINDVTLPKMVPRVLPAGNVIQLPGESFGFIVFPQAQANACM